MNYELAIQASSSADRCVLRYSGAEAAMATAHCDLPRAIQFGLGLLIWFPKGIYDVVAVLGLNAQVVC